MSTFSILSTQAEHAEQLEELQKICFPTLSDDERFKREHYLAHIALFPEGQFVAVAGDLVVGMTTTIRMHFDFDHVDHRFEDIIGGGWLPGHAPDGEWLYGLDVGTHPEFRGRGIGRALYARRSEVVRSLGLLGQVTVGMLSGYASVEDMSIEEYYAAVVAKEINDPTVSMQLRVGFEARGLIRNYLDDPSCADSGALLVLASPLYP